MVEIGISFGAHHKFDTRVSWISKLEHFYAVFTFKYQHQSVNNPNNLRTQKRKSLQMSYYFHH
jgi:hypothetical protein